MVCAWLHSDNLSQNTPDPLIWKFLKRYSCGMYCGTGAVRHQKSPSEEGLLHPRSDYPPEMRTTELSMIPEV
jgi:hypothetical protein